jgi:hypothetical protein
MSNLRFAFRQLRAAPGFTVTALATIAICLGANLAIFAVIDAVLLRPLPFPQPDRLVTIFNTYPKAGVDRDGSSLTNYYERRGSIPALSSLSIVRESTELVRRVDDCLLHPRASRRASRPHACSTHRLKHPGTLGARPEEWAHPAPGRLAQRSRAA